MFHITLHPLDSEERATEKSPSAIIWRNPRRYSFTCFMAPSHFSSENCGAFTTNCSWAQTQSCLHWSLCKTSEPPGSCPTRCLLEFPKCAGNSRCPVQVSTRSSPVWSWWNWCSLQSARGEHLALQLSCYSAWTWHCRNGAPTLSLHLHSSRKVLPAIRQTWRDDFPANLKAKRRRAPRW